MSTATYARRKAEGRCGRCGERAPRPAGTLCQACCDGTRVKAAMERAHERALRQCSVADCGRTVESNFKGLCPTHYRQRLQGKELGPIAPQHAWVKAEDDQLAAWRIEGRTWPWMAAQMLMTLSQVKQRALHLGLQKLPKPITSAPATSILDWEPAPNDEVPDPDEATALSEALERCPRCFLVLPHDGCLPSAYEVASRRQEAA